MIQLTFAQKENIGFQYVLEALQPCSPYGQERVRELRPFSREELPELKRQLHNIDQVLSLDEAGEKSLAQLLRQFMTLRMIRTTAKKCQETHLNEIELFELKRFLLKCHEMLPLWRELQGLLSLEGLDLLDTTPALDILDPRKDRVASFFIADGSSPALLTLRREKRDLEERLRKKPGDETLLGQRSRIAAEEEQEENRLRKELSLALRPHIPAVLQNMEMIGDLDLTAEKARLARQYGGTMPTFTKGKLVLEEMVNPRIADRLKAQGGQFTPVSITLGVGATVITGANMGGKSVALKTVALNLYLIHCGFFPFAKAVSTPVFDGIYMISEDLESVDRGLSSFGGEMVRFNQVVKRLGDGFAFLMLDEFARGTNPEEGAAIVQAVTEYLDRKNAITVLATHYDKVAQKGSYHYQVKGLKDIDMHRLEKELVNLSGQEGVALISRYMNYGLYRVEGRQDCPRDALNICRLLGMDGEILDRVEKIYGA